MITLILATLAWNGCGIQPMSPPGKCIAVCICEDTWECEWRFICE